MGQNVKQKAAQLLEDNPEILFTPAAVAQSLNIPTTRAESILEDLVADGDIESIEFGQHAIQRIRYRWLAE
jgi:hypothetical protein